MARIVIEPEDGDEFERFEIIGVGTLAMAGTVSVPGGQRRFRHFLFPPIRREAVIDLIGDLHSCVEHLRGNVSS